MTWGVGVGVGEVQPEVVGKKVEKLWKSHEIMKQNGKKVDYNLENLPNCMNKWVGTYWRKAWETSLQVHALLNKRAINGWKCILSVRVLVWGRLQRLQ